MGPRQSLGPQYHHRLNSNDSSSRITTTIIATNPDHGCSKAGRWRGDPEFSPPLTQSCRPAWNGGGEQAGYKKGAIQCLLSPAGEVTVMACHCHGLPTTRQSLSWIESHTIFKLSSCVFNRRFSLFVVFRPDKVILPFFIQLSEEEV